jgi:23S rRNA (guanosine2251-2'-O)-methyltransferase
MASVAPRSKNAPPQKKQEEAEDDGLLWGINAVTEALQQQPRRLSEILVEKGKAGGRLQALIELARHQEVRLRFVGPEQMGLGRNAKHQGVVARQTEAPLLSLAEVLAQAERLLILDSIQDPRNLGSILRSALATGFRSVVLTSDRSAPLSGTVARTSAGALAHLDIARVVNLSEALKQMKAAGFWIYGAVAEPQAQSLYTTELRGKLGIIIGSEGKGIRPLVRKHCDHLITIPMATDFNSLNASVAAALILFEVVRQEGKA